jgi:hypothetical protein
MNHYDSKRTLWRNVSSLMTKQYGSENLTRLARECRFSPGTSSRMKAQQTSVGLDVIDTLAGHFGVRPADLVDAAFDPITPRAPSPMALDLAQALDRLTDPVQQERVYALAMQLIEFGMAPQPAPAPTAAAAPAAPAASDSPMRGRHLYY